MRNNLHEVKVNNKDTDQKHNKENNHKPALPALLFNLSRFHTLFWCVHCWLWTGKRRLSLWKLFETPIKMQNLLIPCDFRNIQEWKIPVPESLVEGLQLYLKKDSSTVDFLWILLDFWKHLFYRIPPGDCFSNLELKKSLATSSHTKVLWKIHFVVSIWTE